MFRIFFLTFISICPTIFSQNTVVIKGKILSKMIVNDTIHFSSGIYSKAYYEDDNLSSKVEKNNFIIKSNLTYPHMFVLSLNSEKNKILFRGGEYFFDNYTKNIQLDSLYKIKLLDGPTNIEYKNKFIPFILKNREDNFYAFRFNNGAIFDDRLLNYVKNNPKSYVALWFLIDRISIEGHNEIYEKILNQFSPYIKNGKLWKTAKTEFVNSKIKKNKTFSDFDIKNIDIKKNDIEDIDIKNEKLYLPNTK